MATTLGRLDYLYTQSDDVVADLRYLVDVLGGEQVFAIEDGGIRVAMVSFGERPAILLTDHLEGDRPIHVYAVDDLAAAKARPRASRGWVRRARGRAATRVGGDVSNARWPAHGPVRAVAAVRRRLVPRPARLLSGPA